MSWRPYPTFVPICGAGRKQSKPTIPTPGVALTDPRKRHECQRRRKGNCRSPVRMSSSVLVIGNFLSSSVGTRGVCEDLSVRLRELGWSVLTASSRRHRLARMWDMVATTWRLRRRYHVAQVDVFSGPAFLWAEAVCWTLRRAGKPYVLTLHGGHLPKYAERWPRRGRRS